MAAVAREKKSSGVVEDVTEAVLVVEARSTQRRGSDAGERYQRAVVVPGGIGVAGRRRRRAVETCVAAGSLLPLEGV